MINRRNDSDSVTFDLDLNLES